MLALLILVALAALIYRASVVVEEEPETIHSERFGNRLGRLWDAAHESMRENRFLRAEKALLAILKVDEKNAAAYNRLGILYAKQKEYRDAIDCFEIASSIESTPASLHNLGLIYYETENYDKASAAFEGALKLEDGLAARHVAYARVLEKMGNEKLMVVELEKAVELAPEEVETLTLLHKTYQKQGKAEKVDIIEDKIKILTQPEPKKAPRTRKRLVRRRLVT